MQKKYLVGVDLGTSGTKAALYQIDGKLISDASAEVPLFYPKPGVVEQENEDFYASAAHRRSALRRSEPCEQSEAAATPSGRQKRLRTTKTDTTASSQKIPDNANRQGDEGKTLLPKSKTGIIPCGAFST